MSVKPSPSPGFHLSAEEFRRHGHDAIEWIARYMENVESFPVLSQVKPGWIRSQLPDSPPETPERMEDILADLDRVILPGITHWQSPGFFAFFPGNNSPPSILGEVLSAALGVQGMMWTTSPACTELETHVLDWVAQMLDLPEKFLSTGSGGGVIYDSASSATLCALLAAREQKTRGWTNRNGMSGSTPLVAYASTETHTSMDKAVRIAGVGQENLRKIDVDDSFSMKPDSLEQAIRRDLARDRIPFFVCATLGTTSSTAFDPVEAIGSICQEYGLWLHVDAAMSGTAALCPEFRWLNEGLERADSYCFNPHKWMFVNFDCTCFYTADREDLIRTFSVVPEYLRNPASDSGGVIDYRDWQIPLGRRFRALKLWFVIRSYGIEGLRHHIREHVRLAQLFRTWVRESELFDVAAPTPLNLVCFRHRGGDEATRQVMERVNSSGEMYLTHTSLDGKTVLRMCIGQSQTLLHHIERAWELLCAAAVKVESEQEFGTG